MLPRDAVGAPLQHATHAAICLKLKRILWDVIGFLHWLADAHEVLHGVLVLGLFGAGLNMIWYVGYTRNFGLAGIEAVLLGAAAFLVVVDLVPRR